MPPKKTKVVVAPDEDIPNQAASNATPLAHSSTVLSTSGGEPKRKASRPEASQGTAARASNGLDFLDDILGNTDSNQKKTVDSSSEGTKTKQGGGKEGEEAPSRGRDAGGDDSKVGSSAKRDNASFLPEEEAEEGVSILKDDSSEKSKASATKEDALLRQGEELSGEALRKFMMDKFLNFDDDPVSDLEKILGGF